MIPVPRQNSSLMRNGGGFPTPNAPQQRPMAAGAWGPRGPINQHGQGHPTNSGFQWLPNQGNSDASSTGGGYMYQRPNDVAGGPGLPPPRAPQIGGRPAGQIANVSSTPRPEFVYSPSQTLAQAGSAVAEAHQAADPEYQMKQFARPGMSRGAGTLAAAMPGIQQAESQADRARQEIPMMNNLQNLAFQTQGQYAQGQESLQLFNLLQRLQQNQNTSNMSNISPLLSMLG